MLKIRINNQPVDLPLSMSHELVWRNPLLNYDAVLGGFSTPFSLPFTPRNNRIFGNINNFDAPITSQLFTCEKYLNDHLVEEGFVRLKDADTAYSLYFTTNLGQIFAGKVDHDLATYIPNVTIASRDAQLAGTPTVVFPTIQNPGFFQANAPGGWANVVNNHNGTSYTGPTYVAGIKVHWLLSQIAAACGFSLAGNFMSSADMDKLYILQNVENTSATTIIAADAVRGLTAPQFIAAIRKAIGLVVQVDSVAKTMTIDFAHTFFGNNGQPANPLADWSPYCSPPRAGRNASGLVGIRLASVLNSEDKQSTATSLQPYLTPTTEGNASYYEITSEAMPFAMAGGLPIMDEQGRTATNKQDAKKLVPRLFFYKGLQSTSFGNRPLGDVASGSYSLLPAAKAAGTQFAAEELFWKETWETSFELRMNSRINLADLRGKVFIHTQNYFVKEIVLNANRPTLATLKALRA